MKTLAKLYISYRIYGTCVFWYIHVTRTKGTCFCSKNTVKTHENTSKTVHFMLNIWYMCISVYKWNVPNMHVSAVKTQWKHMKTQAKLCIPFRIHGTCVFWYINVKCTKSKCFCSENTVKTLAKLCYSCRTYGTCVFWYTSEMYQKYMFL
jgi:hypothetical protein